MFLKAITCFLILFLMGNNVIYNSAIEYVASNERVNFFEAFMYCQQANMRLATITSSADQARLDSYLMQMIVDDEDKGNEYGYWLGATNLLNTSSKVYYWLTTGEPVIYTHWLPGRPDDTSIYNCIDWVYTHSLHKGWNDAGCMKDRRYVCEKDWD